MAVIGKEPQRLRCRGEIEQGLALWLGHDRILQTMADQNRAMDLADFTEIVEPLGGEKIGGKYRVAELGDTSDRQEWRNQGEAADREFRCHLGRDAGAERVTEDHDPVCRDPLRSQGAEIGAFGR